MYKHKKNYTGKGQIKQFSVVFLVLLVLYFALIRPLVQQGVNVLQKEIEETIELLQAYVSKKSDIVLPTKEVLQNFQKQLSQQEQNYTLLRNFIDPAKEYLPQGAVEPGLYFIEQLHIVTKRLQRQANSLKIAIPESFGFSKEMPEDTGNVELLLKELDVVDRVVTLLMEQGVKEVALVKSLPAVEVRDEKKEKLFYRELPTQLSFLCESSTLINFLYQLKIFSPVIFVKEITVKRAGGTSLEVKMLLTRFVI
ncbi:MAG: Amuc_1100 family pilus-like protein [Candidatus Omnitrophota bacterium]